jgi:hypothetical protein
MMNLERKEEIIGIIEEGVEEEDTIAIGVIEELIEEMEITIAIETIILIIIIRMIEERMVETIILGVMVEVSKESPHVNVREVVKETREKLIAIKKVNIVMITREEKTMIEEIEEVEGMEAIARIMAEVVLEIIITTKMGIEGTIEERMIEMRTTMMRGSLIITIIIIIITLIESMSVLLLAVSIVVIRLEIEVLIEVIRREEG